MAEIPRPNPIFAPVLRLLEEGTGVEVLDAAFDGDEEAVLVPRVVVVRMLLGKILVEEMSAASLLTEELEWRGLVEVLEASETVDVVDLGGFDKIIEVAELSVISGLVEVIVVEVAEELSPSAMSIAWLVAAASFAFSNQSSKWNEWESDKLLPVSTYQSKTVELAGIASTK
ncbi:uncharacterized protein PAC_09450 [Phialocephala subalpina]|uniref:Uncharacterized protein n=1 Tax=Phialocephala subalpina TaxID=576137 RepID=A0A1L7X3H2_9HELO|nr:uncharacterized protein PAC_09450 [Phialocephala subalpina]